MENKETTDTQGRGESESRLVLQGTEPMMTSRFTGIEPLYTSVSGHAALYRAKRMGKWHVLKCLKPAFADNPLYLGLLQKEFEIGYTLSHPNVVQTVSIEHVDGLGLCIVMEYVEGRTLRQMLCGRSLSGGEAVRIVSQVCSALAYIHSRQIMHRDIKPENIMVTDNGNNVKLIDFGLSDSDSYAVLKLPGGTRRYAAPELIAGEAVDARADIYSLGVLAREVNAVLPVRSIRLAMLASRCARADRDRRHVTAERAERMFASRPYLLVGTVSAVAGMLLAAVLMTVMRNGDGSPEANNMSASRADTVIMVRGDGDAEDAPVDRAHGQDTGRKARASSDGRPGADAVAAFNSDDRLARLNRFAREKTLEMLRDDERRMADTSLTYTERMNIGSGQYNRIERAVRNEVARVADPSQPVHSMFLSAALETMRLTLKDYNLKKYGIQYDN